MSMPLRYEESAVIGEALNRLDANIEGPAGKSAVFIVDNSWNAGFVYRSLYF